MGDPWKKIGPSETPSAEAGGPLEWTPDRLRQFSRWLERWAIYARSRADLADGQFPAAGPEIPAATEGESSLPTKSPSTPGSPAHWQGTTTQGPPAHWLALFENQQPEGDSTAGQSGEGPQALEGAVPEMPPDWIRRFQSELTDYLAIPGSYADGEARSGSSHVIHAEKRQPFEQAPGTTEEILTTQSRGVSDPPDPNNLLQPDNTGQEMVTPAGVQPSREGSSLDSDRTQSRPQASDAAQPMMYEHQESETYLTQRSDVSYTGEPDLTTIQKPSEPQDLAPPPNRPVPGPVDGRVTQLQFRSPAAKDSPSRSMAPDSRPNAQPKPEDLSAGHQITTLRLKATPSDNPMNDALPTFFDTTGQDSSLHEAESDLRSGPESQKWATPDTPPDTPTQPDGMPPSPGVDESRRAEPAWREGLKPAQPIPIRWPTASTQSPWPKLPEVLPIRDPDPHPYQDPERRQRIDREQGGG